MIIIMVLIIVVVSKEVTKEGMEIRRKNDYLAGPINSLLNRLQGYTGISRG